MALVLQPSERGRCIKSGAVMMDPCIRANLLPTQCSRLSRLFQTGHRTSPLTCPVRLTTAKRFSLCPRTVVDHPSGTKPGFIGASAASLKPLHRGFLVIELSKRCCRFGLGNRGDFVLCDMAPRCLVLCTRFGRPSFGVMFDMLDYVLSS